MNLENIVDFLSQIDSTYIYIAAFAIAYVENVFPPFPSDVIVAFCGYMAGLDRVNVVLTLALATSGSTLGFISMYKIGDLFGDKILEKGKIRFIPVDTVHKVENWFKRYGYWIVIINRFLAGTRAVVSFFAGLAEMNLWITSTLSFFSALLWNIILIYGGFQLGKNWRLIGDYLSTYSGIVSALLVIIFGYFLFKYLRKRKKTGR